jgi:hypothetical protein
MEWSDARRLGREFAEWNRFPSLYRSDAAVCVRRRLVVGQFSATALPRHFRSPTKVFAFEQRYFVAARILSERSKLYWTTSANKENTASTFSSVM